MWNCLISTIFGFCILLFCGLCGSNIYNFKCFCCFFILSSRVDRWTFQFNSNLIEINCEMLGWYELLFNFNHFGTVDSEETPMHNNVPDQKSSLRPWCWLFLLLFFACILHFLCENAEISTNYRKKNNITLFRCVERHKRRKKINK